MAYDRVGLRAALIPYFKEKQQRAYFLTSAFADDDTILNLFVLDTDLEARYFVSDMLAKLMNPSYPHHLRRQGKLSIIMLLEFIIQETGNDDALAHYITTITIHFDGHVLDTPENSQGEDIIPPGFSD